MPVPGGSAHRCRAWAAEAVGVAAAIVQTVQLADASLFSALLGNVLLCSLSPALRRAAKVSTALLGHECVSDSASL